MEGTVHHMAVVGCGTRMETPRNLWNCGANGEPVLEPGYPALTPCHSEVYLFLLLAIGRCFWSTNVTSFFCEDNTTTTLFLWSRGGEAVTLPPDTGISSSLSTSSSSSSSSSTSSPSSPLSSHSSPSSSPYLPTQVFRWEVHPPFSTLCSRYLEFFTQT